MSFSWTKYTFICDPDECDTLIELTCKDYGFPNGVMQITCPCGRSCKVLSVEDATINPSTEEKEQKMETTDMPAGTINDLLAPYNPDLLVTYKVIHGYSDAEYAAAKVSSIEWDLHNARQAQKHNAVLQGKIDAVASIILEGYADAIDQDTLREIAEALDIQLTKEVEWSATIEVSGTLTVDLLEDVDVEQEIYDNLYVESQNGQIEIGDTEVTNVREN